MGDVNRINAAMTVDAMTDGSLGIGIFFGKGVAQGGYKIYLHRFIIVQFVNDSNLAPTIEVKSWLLSM